MTTSNSVLWNTMFANETEDGYVVSAADVPVAERIARAISRELIATHPASSAAWRQTAKRLARLHALGRGYKA